MYWNGLSVIDHTSCFLWYHSHWCCFEKFLSSTENGTKDFVTLLHCHDSRSVNVVIWIINITHSTWHLINRLSRFWFLFSFFCCVNTMSTKLYFLTLNAAAFLWSLPVKRTRKQKKMFALLCIGHGLVDVYWSTNYLIVVTRASLFVLNLAKVTQVYTCQLNVIRETNYRRASTALERMSSIYTRNC